MPLRLVDAKAAAYWAGRSPGTIWRWASEGRITSYGGRYDLGELPAAERDQWTREITRLPGPPPLPDRQRAPRAA